MFLFVDFLHHALYLFVIIIPLVTLIAATVHTCKRQDAFKQFPGVWAFTWGKLLMQLAEICLFSKQGALGRKKSQGEESLGKKCFTGAAAELWRDNPPATSLPSHQFYFPFSVFPLPSVSISCWHGWPPQRLLLSGSIRAWSVFSFMDFVQRHLGGVSFSSHPFGHPVLLLKLEQVPWKSAEKRLDSTDVNFLNCCQPALKTCALAPSWGHVLMYLLKDMPEPDFRQSGLPWMVS